MGKIYCSECGEELDDSMKFCSKCGIALDNNSPKMENKSNNKNIFLIVGIIGVLVILFIVGVAFMAQGTGGTTYTINGVDFNIPNAYSEYESSSSTVYGLYSETYDFSSGGYSYDHITIMVTDIGDNDVSDLEDKHRNDWIWEEVEIDGKRGFNKLSTSSSYGFVYYENNKQILIEVPVSPYAVSMSYEELISYIIQ